jgi:LPXTG-site transpeptidase (sortase) family protein
MSGRLFHLLSTLLVIAGVAMLAVFGHHLWSGASGKREGIEAFEAAKETRRVEERADASVASPAGKVTLLPPFEPVGGHPLPDEPDMREWSESRKSAYEDLQGAANPLPEGILRIPAVQLEVPVFAGTGDFALTRGAGRIEGTPELGNPGNTGIAAHRDGWFRVLKDVRVGDAVEIETLQGELQFRITETFVVEPADVQVLAPTEQHSLTLVTCYPFYFVGSAPQRYIVRAVRT